MNKNSKKLVYWSAQIRANESVYYNFVIFLSPEFRGICAVKNCPIQGRIALWSHNFPHTLRESEALQAYIVRTLKLAGIHFPSGCQVLPLVLKIRFHPDSHNKHVLVTST
jgi:hypothetical protein